VIAMARNLRKHLGVVVAIIIVVIIVTIYFRDGAVFQDLLMVPSNFLTTYCLEINKQNLITSVSWIRLLSTFS